MGYKLLLCCGNNDCDYDITENVVEAVSSETAVNLANQLNREKEDYCPKCGELLRYYPNYRKK